VIGPSMERARRVRASVKEIVWTDPAVHTVGLRLGADAALYVHVGVHPGMPLPPCPDLVEGVPVRARHAPPRAS
jgi:hypothetical protein